MTIKINDEKFERICNEILEILTSVPENMQKEVTEKVKQKLEK